MNAKNLYNKLLVFIRHRLNLAEYTDIYAAEQGIRNNISFSGPNVYILFGAIIIASIGLNVNSIPVIIGAMLISPLMSPIIGFGLGLGLNDTKLLTNSLKNLGIMVAISLLASTLYFIITPLEAENPTELLARTNPSIYDVMIAFFGGFAGMLEITRKEKGTVMSGVAIATALMPPLCTAGYGIANLNWYYISGALYLFFINSVFIALATYLTVRYMKFPQIEGRTGKLYKRQISYILLILIVIIPSIFSGYNIIKETNFSMNTRRFVKEHQTLGGTYIYDYSINTQKKPYTLDLRLAGETLSDTYREQLYTDIEQYGIMRSQIVIHEDATIRVNRLNETEIVKDWLESTERQLRAREDTIKALHDQISQYEQLELPANQVTAELRAQWDNITSVAITRGAQVTDVLNDNDDIIVVLIETKKPLPHTEIDRMHKWLKVRLQSEAVKIVVQ